jgi:hypothetical protein
MGLGIRYDNKKRAAELRLCEGYKRGYELGAREFASGKTFYEIRPGEEGRTMHILILLIGFIIAIWAHALVLETLMIRARNWAAQELARHPEYSRMEAGAAVRRLAEDFESRGCCYTKEGKRSVRTGVATALQLLRTEGHSPSSSAQRY